MSKAAFIELYSKYIKRSGAEKLLDYLENKTDFFTAPASTKYHLSCEGGLVEHSIHVFERLRELCVNEQNYQMSHGDKNTPFTLSPTPESIAICGLLHDVCKANCYKVGTRNVKENNVWKQVPFYTFDDGLPYGHGEKSVFIIRSFINLSSEEAFAIRYHMGFSSDGDKRNVGKAFQMYHLALLTHFADMEATYIDEREM